jgi:phospholipase C
MIRPVSSLDQPSRGLYVGGGTLLRPRRRPLGTSSLDPQERARAEAHEREVVAAPEATMRRRDFLSRSAYAAGLAGAASSLPLDLILGEAAKREARAAGLPSPSNLPIDHFVVLMMENRSFDHYFGWLPNADGVQDRSYPDPDNGGVLVPTRHASTLDTGQWQGCGHPDPNHSWNGGREQLGSALANRKREPDGFLAGENDEFALCYYNEGELGFIHPAGREFTVFDRFHCSLMASTWPNRYYKWSAQSGGRKDNSPPVETLGNQWETLFDRALKTNPANLPGLNGLTARYYNSDLPFSAVWGARGASWTRPVAEYYADCAAGTLPNITFVDPPFRDGGGGDGVSADEHPLGDVRLGQAFMSDVVHAFIESPNWERGALFIVYDEWGGFFDHVCPPSVPDARRSSDLNEDFGLMGYRIPAVAVSPYAKRGAVSHTLCGFESIIKLITYRFGLGSLTTRDAQANNIGLSMDWSRPNFERPDLPDPDRIVSNPCTFGGGDVIDGQSTHESDLAALEDLAERFGIPTGTGSPTEIFREPDSLQQSLVP